MSTQADHPSASHDPRRGKPVSRGAGLGLVALAAVLWSGGGVGVKVLPLSAMSIAGFRSVFACGAMIVALVTKRLIFPSTSPSHLTATLKRPLVWVAALSYALMVICFVVSAKLTTAANAIFIQYTGPIYVALLSWPLLGERVRPRDVVATIASVVGMGLFFRGELSSDGKLGNLIAVLSSFGFAGLPLALRREEIALSKSSAADQEARGLASAESPIIAMTLGNALAALICAPFAVNDVPRDHSTLATVAALGVFQIALPYLLYGVAVRALSALESSLVAMIEPVLSPIWVLLATGEKPTKSAIAGGAIILCAVLFRSIAPGKSRQQIT